LRVLRAKIEDDDRLGVHGSSVAGARGECKDGLDSMCMCSNTYFRARASIGN
jgi:hypothetical protein